MSRRRLLELVAIAALLATAGILLGRQLLTPTSGQVLVLLSASRPERLASSPLAIHGSSGWLNLGTASARSVPRAPGTATVAQSSVPLGTYDAVRLAGMTLPVHAEVGRDGVNPILIAVHDARPVESGAYAGSAEVSLGLNELAGRFQPVPGFRLRDQFDRSFSRSDITGRDVVLAAFNTGCRDTCPLVTGLLFELRKSLPPSVLVLEATTDPGDISAVLRAYAGGIGASWPFLTGTSQTLGGFWNALGVGMGRGSIQGPTLLIIDSHGYVRKTYTGVPDVGGTLPSGLIGQLDPRGRQLLASHGDGWGQAQVVDDLHSIGGLVAPASRGGGEARPFTLRSLDGRDVALSQFSGRPLLINFWASYCVPCRVEMPLIERVARQHPELVVLLVDERDDLGAAKRFVADLHVRSTVLFDGDGRVGDEYGIGGLPTTIFVRGDGSVEGRYIGQTNKQILGAHISAIGA